MKLIMLFCGLLLVLPSAFTQDKKNKALDSLARRVILEEEVVISANKWEQQLNEVPNKIVKISKQDILTNHPQTAADLLAQTGTVFVQKSQLGGGSPMIRGFATNRVLLVADGVRMNNAIYRSGNLQNIISIDPLSVQTAEVIFGPGSLIYGSDAIGGVMDFHTLEPGFSPDKKMLVRGSAVARYASVNKEKTVHADINLGWKKWSLLTSVSHSSFDDLKMGKNGGPDSYLRKEYIERINGIDSIRPNTDPRIQRFSGYDQLNILQKVRFRPVEKVDIQYSFTYAGTGTAPRYDRLIQYRNGSLRFAEWDYGPMLWRMHNLQVLHARKNGLYDEARVTIAYQNYEESRIERSRGNNNRNTQSEFVDAVSINWDATKTIGRGKLYFGIGHVYNKVGSIGQITNLTNGNRQPGVTRYPDGSNWTTSSAYGSYKINVHPKFSLTTGLRYSFNTLTASFDSTFIKFPFTKAEIRDGAITGNAGLVYRPAERWQINGNLSTGYRMPNVDDIGKLFESVPGNVSVPNPGLTPEYAWNFELGLVKNIPNLFRLEINGFYTLLTKAIVRRPFTLFGEDSVLFNGTLSRVEALQNLARASVYGLQLSATWSITPYLSIETHANWINGKETDDVKNEQVPLRHAPPFYGSSSIKYKCKRTLINGTAFYNSTITNENLSPTEQAKVDIYAMDANGRPFSPGWYTLNLKVSYTLNKNLLISGGWENITNMRYRPYSSGIVAGGSNLIISLRASW